MNQCDLCKKDLINRSSYDLYLSITTYDEEGEPVKTGSEPGIDHGFARDYMVICDRRGCRSVVKTLWNRLVNTVTLGG